ncbi:MAG: hypothetical protein H7Z14_18245 [Anaerolineae bacterium]|nr:hypothetical protein [Phycisphaerae bacterium]
MFGWRRTAADRETIIALRATHTAMRVAREVAYPQLPLPAGKEIDPRHVFSESRIVDYESSPPEVLRYYSPSAFRSWHYWLLIGMLLLAIIIPFLIATY